MTKEPTPRKRKRYQRTVMDGLMKQANKAYGEGTVLNAHKAFLHMNHLPLGHLIGDLALHGGIPQGQSAMFIGKEGGGKTTQAMRCVAEFQMKHPTKTVLWIDTEHTFDPVWAESHGVDLEGMYVVDTIGGEDAIDFAKSAKKSDPGLGMIVVDSLSQLVPMKEYDESVGDHQVALNARLIGRMCNHLKSASSERRINGLDPVTEILINQWRMSIGGMARDPKIVPGGRHLNHYCSTHLEFKSYTTADTDEEGFKVASVVNHTMVVKRKKGASSIMTGEYRVVVSPEHPLPVGSYDEAGTIRSFAKKVGLYGGAGQSQYFEGYDPRFKNQAAAEEWLEANPSIARDIKRSILMYRREKAGLTPLPPDGYLLRPNK